MPYTYNHPRPMVTVDIFLTRFNIDHLELLLIKRKNIPYKDKWALPGGYVEINESLEAAAKRELFEETGIDNIPLYKLYVFGEPGRDPRGRTITLVYFGVLPLEISNQVKAGDDAVQSQWYSLNNLPQLAFDHDQIIKACFDNLKINLLHRFWFLLFVNNKFSTEKINGLLAILSDIKLPIDNIRTILNQLPFVKMGNDNLTFFKKISNKDLFQLENLTIANIWQNILIN